MWEVVDNAAAKRKRVKQDTSVRFGENVPIQEEKRTDKPKLSYEDTKVYYSQSLSATPTQTLPVTTLPFSVFTSRLEASPSQGVIQRKQTTPLTVRLREQGIEADSFGPEIAELIGLYDNLDNGSATESLQKDYLNSLLGMLNIRLVSEAGFVFFFLERAGSTHRSKTDFGKYRYTVRLADNSNILNNACGTHYAVRHPASYSGKYARCRGTPALRYE